MRSTIPDYCRGCTLWLRNEKERKLKEKEMISFRLRSFRKTYKMWREIHKGIKGNIKV